jgi:hypothetical protein
VITELNPAPEETIDLIEQIEQLNREIGVLILGQAALKSALEHAEERLSLDIAHDRQRIAKLERDSHKIPMLQKGEKTEKRLKRIKEILAEQQSCSYRELEHLLSITPKERNRLISQLDNRVYEVFTRNGDKRQKVLRLKDVVCQK